MSRSAGRGARGARREARGAGREARGRRRDAGGEAAVTLQSHVIQGFYRRKTRGIAWFKDTAIEHLARLHALAAILERNGYPIDVVTEDRIGYVVYEDDAQVVAEPFADTRTR